MSLRAQRRRKVEPNRSPKELNGFAKIDLAPGEIRTVTLILYRTASAYWDGATHS